MSATSFGGSFELTQTDDSTTRNIFQKQLINASLHSQFPWLRYIPFAPPRRSIEMDEMVERIISRRRQAMDAGEETKDLLQIFVDTHDAHPDEFTVKHVMDEMRLFMCVGETLMFRSCTYFWSLGSPAVTQPPRQQHSQSSFSYQILRSSRSSSQKSTRHSPT